MRPAVQYMDERLPARFWKKTAPCPMSGCWLWTGADNGRGYGNFNPGTGKVYTHRFAYLVLVGPIPDGLVIDHICRTPSCCNPLHLEPVTVSENAIRGEAGHARGAQLRAVTHCPQGHAYEGDNIYPGWKGERQCRECLRDRARSRYWRKRHGVEAPPLRKARSA